MPDITLCRDPACGKAGNCYRFMAHPDGVWQSFFTESPRHGENKCKYHLPMPSGRKGGRMAKKPPVKKTGKK